MPRREVRNLVARDRQAGRRPLPDLRRTVEALRAASARSATPRSTSPGDVAAAHAHAAGRHRRSSRGSSRRADGPAGRADREPRAAGRGHAERLLPGRGARPSPGGDEVVPIINKLSRRFAHVILTQDWHCEDHLSFASSHPGKKPLERVAAALRRADPLAGPLRRGHAGAEFHPKLDVAHCELVIRKGYHRDIDSYSAFFENDRQTPTGLAGYLRERGLTRLFVVGLATDFCVAYSALDARRLGFEVTVIEAGCRGIDVDGSLAARGSRWRRPA